MEKKNVIFLSVIAIATLLVAAVGTTFAYFTATISTSGTAATSVKTKTVAGATMAMGNAITATGALPGYKEVKPMTITGSGAAGAQNANAVISVTPSVSGFGSHIKWTLYKSATAITCTHSQVTDGGKYYATDNCKIPEGATSVLSGTTSAATKDIEVAYNTKDNYYLVVEYINDTTADQNSEQGKTFTVTMGFVAKA